MAGEVPLVFSEIPFNRHGLMRVRIANPAADDIGSQEATGTGSARVITLGFFERATVIDRISISFGTVDTTDTFNVQVAKVSNGNDPTDDANITAITEAFNVGDAGAGADPAVNTAHQLTIVETENLIAAAAAANNSLETTPEFLVLLLPDTEIATWDDVHVNVWYRETIR